MPKNFTTELKTLENVKVREQSLLLPERESPSDELLQRILNYSKSLEVKKTRSAGVVVNVLS
jgi:hypothetical protein